MSEPLDAASLAVKETIRFMDRIHAIEDRPVSSERWWGVEHTCGGERREYPVLHWADEPEEGAGPRQAFECDACGDRYAFRPEYGWHNDGDECIGPHCINMEHDDERDASESGQPPDPDYTEDGDCECGQPMSAHAGGFALLHHDEVIARLRATPPLHDPTPASESGLTCPHGEPWTERCDMPCHAPSESRQQPPEASDES